MWWHPQLQSTSLAQERRGHYTPSPHNQHIAHRTMPVATHETNTRHVHASQHILEYSHASRHCIMRPMVTAVNGGPPPGTTHPPTTHQPQHTSVQVCRERERPRQTAGVCFCAATSLPCHGPCLLSCHGPYLLSCHMRVLLRRARSSRCAATCSSPWRSTCQSRSRRRRSPSRRRAPKAQEAPRWRRSWIGFQCTGRA